MFREISYITPVTIVMQNQDTAKFLADEDSSIQIQNIYHMLYHCELTEQRQPMHFYKINTTASSKPEL